MTGQLAGDDPFRAMPSKELPADRRPVQLPFQLYTPRFREPIRVSATKLYIVQIHSFFNWKSVLLVQPCQSSKQHKQPPDLSMDRMRK